MTTIEASYDSLFHEAESSTTYQFVSACMLLDNKFGEGYAAQNPDLLAQLVMAMTIDYSRTTFAKVVGEFVDAYREGTQALTSG